MPLSKAEFAAVLLTLELASLTTLLLLLIGTPIAWWLTRTDSWLKRPVGAVVALPLVLPPTVIGSVFYSLPFVVQPLQNAFEAIGRAPLEAAATLRASPWDSFFSVVLPLARPGFITAAILSFAHTIGEFGVVLMIGGNIPGKTQVVSVQIYNHVEAMEYAQAHWLAGGMLAFSFIVLLTLYSGRSHKMRAL